MSWSVNFIGTPEKVTAALTEYSSKLTGASKEEYDKALPNIIGIVQQNFNTNPEMGQPFVKLAASGHGYSKNGVPEYNSCTVSVEMIPGVLV